MLKIAGRGRQNVTTPPSDMRMRRIRPNVASRRCFHFRRTNVQGRRPILLCERASGDVAIAQGVVLAITILYVAGSLAYSSCSAANNRELLIDNVTIRCTNISHALETDA